MKININQFGAFLILLVTNQTLRKEKANFPKKYKTDEGARIKNAFVHGYATDAGKKLGLTNVSVTRWTKEEMGEGKKATALYALWKNKFVDVCLTEKGGKNRKEVIEHLTGKHNEKEQDKKSKPKLWSENEIIKLIESRSRAVK